MAASAESVRRTLAMSLAVPSLASRDSDAGVVGDAGVEERGLAERGEGGRRDRDGGRRPGPRWGRRPRSRPARRRRRPGRRPAVAVGSTRDLITTDVTMPPRNRPDDGAEARSGSTARRTATPMISRVPQPGHSGVPSVSGRAHVGQLKTCASASPIAIFGGPSGRWPDSRPRRRLKVIAPSVAVGAAPMHPTRWSRDAAGTFGRRRAPAAPDRAVS